MIDELRASLAADTADTVRALNEKVREAATMGKPSEACDYASALQGAAGAFDSIVGYESGDE